MVNQPDAGSSALEAPTFGGRMPARSGDMAIETHGIKPIPEDNRYGSPWRLFTVWFAPQMNMTGVFTGTLAITFGLGFWLGFSPWSSARCWAHCWSPTCRPGVRAPAPASCPPRGWPSAAT